MKKHFRIGNIKKSDNEDLDEAHIDQASTGHIARIIVYGTEVNNKRISGKPLAKLIVKLLNEHYAELDSEKEGRKRERAFLHQLQE